jgi:HK97 family phage major capsid protein
LLYANSKRLYQITKSIMKLQRKQITNREARQFADTFVKSRLEREIKRLGLDKVDLKFGNHGGLTEDEIKSLSKKEKVARFIKAVFLKDVATVKALSEGTPADGGYQVPEEFASEVNRIVEDFGLVRKLSRKIPMNSDTMNIPRLSASVGVTFPGENTAGTESQPVWENVQLLAKTAVGLTVASNELLADANVSVVDLLAELFAEALAGTEDAQGLVGTGAPFTGIANIAGVNELVMSAGKDTYAEATGDDYRDLIAKVKPWSLQGSAFFMHRTVWAEVQKLKDGGTGAYIASALNPVFSPISGAQGASYNAMIVGTIWGYPVYLSDKLPATSDVSQSGKVFALFGNLNHLYFGDRATMSLSISDSATVGTNNAFEMNQSAVRVTERFALAVGLPGAFARLKTA